MSLKHPIFNPKHPVTLGRVPIGTYFELITTPRLKYKKVGVRKCQSIIKAGLKYPKGTVQLTKNLLVKRFT